MLSTRLRAETRDEHEAIERSLELTSPHVTIGYYRHYLERTLGYYEPLEAHLRATLAAVPEPIPDLDARWKAATLRADLRALGATTEALDGLPRCAKLPAVERSAAALGSLYVLEGATLGGQYLSRHLAATLGVSPSCGGAFLASYGGRVGAMWRSFGDRLDRIEPDGADAALCIATARETFATLQSWLALPAPAR